MWDTLFTLFGRYGPIPRLLFGELHLTNSVREMSVRHYRIESQSMRIVCSEKSLSR